MHLSRTVIAALAVLLASSLAPARGLTVVVDTGPLGDVEQAEGAERQVNWWDDDKTDDTACTVAFAAGELQAFLPRCTAIGPTGITWAAPDKLPAEGDLVILLSGDAPVPGALLSAEETAVAESAESYRIRSLSRAGRVITVIRGRDRVGVLYGAYAWLERLGMGFYGLGAQGTVQPDKASALPADLDIAGTPSYLTRGFWAWEDRGDSDFFLWMARNRLNLWTPASVGHIPLLKKLGIKLIAAHHDVQHFTLSPKAEYPYNRAGFAGDDAKPADPYAAGSEFAGDTDKDGKLTYFEAHPEWYCLKAGKRSDHIAPEVGDNFCTSNADARTELVRNLVSNCVDGRWKYADVLNFWMLDGGKWCECPECVKQGTYTDRLMIVIDATLRGLKAARQEGRLRRPLQLVTLAYHETLAPPTRPLPAGFDYANLSVTYFPIERCYAHPLADPTCTEVNERMTREYQGWATGAGRPYQGSLFIGEYYNVSGLKSMPVLFQRIMAADIPWYYRMGARHFHYMHTPTRLWGTWTLNQYQMARLLWNVNENADTLVNDYFARYYPATSSLMRGFYRDLELATANCKFLKHYVTTPRGGYSLRGAMAAATGDLFPFDHLHYEPHHPLLNDGPDLSEMVEAIDRARATIAQAMAEAREPAEAVRLAEDERRFAYGEATIKLYAHLARTIALHRAGDAAGARREFAEAEPLAANLAAMVDLVQVASSHANAANGLEGSGLDGIFEQYRKLYSATQPAAN